MELTYTKVGDYYIPNLALDNDSEYEIGIYGRMRQQYLEEHHHGTYTSLLLTGNFLIPAMAKQEGVTEALKASNQMEWVGRMNNIRNRAEEIILHELVYV